MIKKFFLLFPVLIVFNCYSMERAGESSTVGETEKEVPGIFAKIESGEEFLGGHFDFNWLSQSPCGRHFAMRMRAIEIIGAYYRVIEEQTTQNLAISSLHYFPRHLYARVEYTDKYPLMMMPDKVLGIMATGIFGLEGYLIEKEYPVSSSAIKLLEGTRVFDCFILAKIVETDGVYGTSNKIIQDALNILKKTTQAWPPPALKGDVHSTSAYTVVKEAFEKRKKNRVDEKDWSKWQEKWPLIECSWKDETEKSTEE